MHSKHLLLLLLALLLCGGSAMAVLLTGNDPGLEDHVLAWDGSEEVEEEYEAPDTLTGEGQPGDGNGEGTERSELGGDEVAEGKKPPQPRPEVWIRGKVVNRYAAPVKGARVHLTINRRGRGRGRGGRMRIPKPHITGKDGSFAFRGKGFRDLDVTLEIKHQDFALALHRDNFQSVEPGQQLSVGDVRIFTGGVVSGSITDMSGVVLPGATARLHPQDGNLRQHPQRWKIFPPIKTNNSGYFQISHVPPGQYRIEGVAPHRQRRFTDLVTISDAEETELKPIQLGPGFEVIGQVFKPEGGPAAKADVRLLRARGGGRAQRRRTDKEGRFKFDHLPKGLYSVQVDAKGYLRKKEHGIRAEQSPVVNLTLLHGLKIAGIVMDGVTNRPVSFYAARVRKVQGVEDLAVTQMRNQLLAMQKEMQATRNKLKGRKRRQFERKMEQQMRKSVQQLRQKGVEVELRGRGRGPRRNEPWRNRNRGPGRPGNAGRPQKRAGGRFEFTGLQEGIYVVDFSSPTHQRLRSRQLELRRGGIAPHVSVTLERGLLVAGRVIDKTSGQPLARARVDLLITQTQKPANAQRNPMQALRQRLAPPGPQGQPFLSARTNKRGEFKIRQAGQGNYILVARAGGHSRGFTDPFDLTHDSNGFELALGRLGVIYGRVDGIPPDKLKSARVIVTDLRRNKTVKVQEDMTYRVEDLQPGNYMVRAFVGSFDSYRRSSARAFARMGNNFNAVQADVKIGEGSEVRFTARINQEPVGGVTGQILVNGSGARAFRIQMREILSTVPGAPRIPGLRPNRFNAVTDQKGNYKIREVSTGQYQMTVRTAGRRGREVHRQQIYVHADRDNRQPTLALMLGDFAAVVTPEDNRPVKNLRGNVQLLPGVRAMPKNWRQYRSQNLVQNEPVRNGRFRFREVAVGEYLMVLRINGFQPRVETVYVDGSTVARELKTGKRRGRRKRPRGKARPRGQPRSGGKPRSGKPKPGGKARPKGRAAPKKTGRKG